ncbi:MtrB/PioB family outer membrane beta-barrel protein [Bdellovibrionota bacterium FG-1]
MKLQKAIKVSYWSVVLGCVFLSAAAIAEDQGFKLGSFDLTGGADLGFIWVNNSHQSAKFNEYRDWTTGPVLNGDVRAVGDGYYTGLLLSDVARKDQKYVVDGGKYNAFKYKLYFDQIIHNLSFNASTFYAGVGTNNLTYDTTAGSEPWRTLGGWTNGFDYTITRKKFGGDFSVNMLSPFFLDFGVNQESRTGLRPIGVAQGQGFELPAPVDAKTTMVYADLAFRQDNIAVSLRYDLSSFSTDNQYMSFMDPVIATSATVANNGADVVTIAPTSIYNRVGLQAAIGELPLNSSFGLRGGMAWLSDTIDPQVQPLSYATSGVTTWSAAGNSFNGKIGYSSFDTSLTSRPISDLDTRLFFDYLDKRNDSDTFNYNKTVVTAAGASTATWYQTETFSYRKADAGLEAGYRLPFSTKLRGGYNHLLVHRDRADALTTNDNHYFAKVTNNTLDWLGFKAKMDYLARASDFEGGALAPDVPFGAYARPFDVADKTMWKLETGLSFSDLVPDLDFGVDYGWRSNKYTATTLGRKWDQTNEVFFDVGYTIKKIRFNAFADAEGTLYNTTRRYISGSITPKDPSTPPVDPTNSTTAGNYAFNFDENTNNLTWGYGFNVVVPVLEQLDLVASWSQNVSSGSMAFNAGQPANGVPLWDLNNLEGARHSLADIHGTYRVNTKLSATVGFGFDQLTYSDDAWDGYTDRPAISTAASPGLLTGAGADLNYTAQMYYLSASYRL